MEQRLSGSSYVAPLKHMEQRLPSLKHREQLCWSMLSSGSLGADTVARLEQMEQRLPWSTESSCAGARGAAALWEQIQFLHWRTWNTTSLAVDSIAPLLHMYQQSCSVCSGKAAAPRNTCICSQRATAPRAPTQLLSVLQGSCCSSSIMLHWSMCICSQRAAAPRAPAELLCVLHGNRCSMCSSGAPVSAPRELLLYVLQQSCSLCSRDPAAPCAPVEHLYLLPESGCSTYYSIAALCDPTNPLLHVLQWSTCICS